MGMRGQLGEVFHRSGLLRPLRLMRAAWNRDLRILAYHRVLTLPDPGAFNFDLELVSASAQQFREQMALVKRDYVPIRLGDVAQAIDEGRRLPTNAVVVTFDDGYDDNFHVAYPILKELGVPATFFVATGHVDHCTPFAYDWLVYLILHTPATRLDVPELGLARQLPPERDSRRRLAGVVLDALKNLDDTRQLMVIARLESEWGMPRSMAPVEARPMTWPQLRQMQADGFEIGSHGVNHRMLAKLSDTELQTELQDSRTRLETELGVPASLLSYPVGGDRAFDGRVIAAMRAAGFRLACSYICGTNVQPITNPCALYRLPVERTMNLGWFAAMLALPKLMSYPTPNRVESCTRGSVCSF